MVNRTASAESLQAELQHLCEAIKAYAHEKPSVTGTERLLKRAQRDRVYVDGLLQSTGKAKSAAAVEDKPALHSSDLLGVRNNIRGLQAELDLARQAEAVVCLGAKFYSQVSAGEFCSEIASTVALKQTHPNGQSLVRTMRAARIKDWTNCSFSHGLSMTHQVTGLVVTMDHR
ncbi:hypothetical protein ABBQ38_001534 [Trebouxia sp. C0009 RCD-2024]